MAKKKSATRSKKTSGRTSKKAGGAARAPNLHPPAAVRKAFARGLELKDDFGGKGLVGTTVTWARKIVDGKPVDKAKAKKMRAYFRRHAGDRKPGWGRPPTPGYVAWLLWGGDAGQRWAERIVGQFDRAAG